VDDDVTSERVAEAIWEAGWDGEIPDVLRWPNVRGSACAKTLRQA
jgi:hypothetical protein